MAVVRWFVLVLSLAFAVAASDRAAQNRSSFANPAEYDAFMAALNTRDAEKRATAMEVFIAWYPASVLRTDAYEQAMAAWHAANQPAKADVIAGKLLQADPDNVRALANRVYGARARAIQGDQAAMAPMVDGGRARRRRPGQMAQARRRSTMTSSRAPRSRWARCSTARWATRRCRPRTTTRRGATIARSVAAEPDNLQDVYQLAVSQLEGTPLDALGFWFAARSIAIARAAKSDTAADDIDRYVRSRYRLYRGSEEGWNELLARVVAGEKAPPGGLREVDPARADAGRARHPGRRGQRSRRRSPSPTGRWSCAIATPRRPTSAAAEKTWKAIVDKQQGGGTRIKIPVKVISATPDVIEAAITDEAQAGNVADLHIAMARPLAPLPAAGIEDRHRRHLERLQAAALHVHDDARRACAPNRCRWPAAPCADPRPQMCTRDYRPACGLHRDGTRKTYGNACSACSNPDVLTQSAGACP